MTVSKILSTTLTRSGVKVEKFLEESTRKGFGKVCKKITYPEGSKMHDLGIFSVNIRNAGKQGKRIMYMDKNKKCIALGVTKPTSTTEQNIISQIKEYIKAIRILKYRNDNILNL